MKMKEPVTCNRSTCNSPQAITLSIGILFAPAITFRLNGTYWNKDQKYSGEYTPDSFHIPRPINSIESAAPKPVCAVTACECHRFMEA